MKRWGMVIDLGQCIGCGSCSRVCSEVHGSETSWRQINDLGLGPDATGIRVSVPANCMHCADAPCVEVCPTTASYFRPDGIVGIDYEKCIGCGYCILACPYDARTLASLQGVTDGDQQRAQPWAEVATKCTFCSEKIDFGLTRGLVPGVDFAATPECVNTCSTGALLFGDLADPSSTVSMKIKRGGMAQINLELRTAPAVYYIVPEEMRNR